MNPLAQLCAYSSDSEDDELTPLPNTNVLPAPGLPVTEPAPGVPVTVLPAPGVPVTDPAPGVPVTVTSKKGDATPQFLDEYIPLPHIDIDMGMGMDDSKGTKRKYNCNDLRDILNEKSQISHIRHDRKSRYYPTDIDRYKYGNPARHTSRWDNHCDRWMASQDLQTKQMDTVGMGLQSQCKDTDNGGASQPVLDVPRNSHPTNPVVPFWPASPEIKKGLEFSVNGTKPDHRETKKDKRRRADSSVTRNSRTQDDGLELNGAYNVPLTKKYRPYIPPSVEKEAFIIVNNQDIMDCTDTVNNRYDTRILRRKIATGLEDYNIINGLVIALYMPQQVQSHWKNLEFGVKCYVNRSTIEMEANFAKHISDIIRSSKYSSPPQTLVLCFTRNVAYGSESLLDVIKRGVSNGWKIIIWTWALRLDYQIKKYCVAHKSIQLNYLDNVSGIFYHERK